LHVREWGNPDAIPILLIHGWSQSHLCWRRQYESELQKEFRLVAPDLRGALLETIKLALLVTHGRSDTVVLPAMADYIAAHCRTAELSWYEGVGHAAFLEEPERFNRELARFARKARGRIER